MNRAILYARVSTPKQAELYSLDHQIQQEQTYASELGLSIVAELREISYRLAALKSARHSRKRFYQ